MKRSPSIFRSGVRGRAAKRDNFSTRLPPRQQTTATTDLGRAPCMLLRVCCVWCARREGGWQAAVGIWGSHGRQLACLSHRRLRGQRGGAAIRREAQGVGACRRNSARDCDMHGAVCSTAR
jgi:hypothetical protein